MGDHSIMASLARVKPVPAYIAGLLTPIAFDRVFDYAKTSLDAYMNKKDREMAEIMADAIIKRYRESTQTENL